VADKETEIEFAERIRQHGALIHKVCRMYAYSPDDRQDLYQEIVIHLWNAYPTFRGQARFSTWLYRVALNTAITGLRRQNRWIPYEPEHAAQPAEEADEELWQQLQTAIARLNDIEKAIVMLYLEDRSFEDMEDILGISQGNLRVKMTRIKDKLRQLVKNG